MGFTGCERILSPVSIVLTVKPPHTMALSPFSENSTGSSENWVTGLNKVMDKTLTRNDTFMAPLTATKFAAVLYTLESWIKYTLSQP